MAQALDLLWRYWPDRAAAHCAQLGPFHLLAAGEVMETLHPGGVKWTADDEFEAWATERFTEQLKSPEYRESAEYHYLRAEWERSRLYRP